MVGAFGPSEQMEAFSLAMMVEVVGSRMTTQWLTRSLLQPAFQIAKKLLQSVSMAWWQFTAVPTATGHTMRKPDLTCIVSLLMTTRVLSFLHQISLSLGRTIFKVNGKPGTLVLLQVQQPAKMGPMFGRWEERLACSGI